MPIHGDSTVPSSALISKELGSGKELPEGEPDGAGRANGKGVGITRKGRPRMGVDLLKVHKDRPAGWDVRDNN